MKKAIKLFLVLSLMIPTIAYTVNQETVIVQAKTSGDYTYEIINDTKVAITNYNGSEKDLTIPDEIDGKQVTKIGYGAFAECKSIETLVIPETITTIDSYAFSQCGQINTIEIPDSVVSIGRYAFAGNHNLKTIRIPNKIRSLGYGVFFDCISLTEINLPEGLQNIGGTAFGNCRSLKSITFPSSMVSLESNAFSDCIALESVVIPDGVTTLGSSVFSGCLSLIDITLPETLISMGQSTFKDCIALESIHLPDNVTTLAYALFSGCTSLTDVNIPKKVSSIGNAAFSGCSSLTTINIPDTVQELGENVFSGCIGLEEIYIPDSVTTIGASAFTYCANLTKVRLPKNLKLLDTSTFRYCDSLESVVLPSGMSKLGSTVFADCPKLKSVTFPSTVSEIGSRILSGSPQAVMLVSSGSKAYSYAVNNRYEYRLIESGINLDKATLKMTVGDTNSFSAIIAPYTIINNSQLTWSSSNPAIVEVDANGNVLAKAVGIATITASNANGQSASAEVTVDDTIIPIKQITLNYNNLTIRKDTSVGLRASITPNNTTMSKTIRWESDNTEIVTVGSTGSLLARHPGTTTVRAISSNGLVAECEVVVISEIKSVSLNQTAMTLDIDAKQQLRATINPSDTTDLKDLTWVSSNTKVATVDQNGEVTTLSAGTATITVITVNGKKAECKITVVKSQEPKPIESVSLNKQSLDLNIGSSSKLIATINPSDTTDSKTLVWTSSDESVATVSDGTVKAVSAGTAVITVTTSNGKTANCIVTVAKNVIEITGVTLNKPAIELNEGQQDTLIANILPADTTEDKTLSWDSDNENVATVVDGKVTAIKAGTAVITVTTSNGKTANCKVTVTKKVIEITDVVLNKATMVLDEGQQDTLIANILPADTTEDKTLSWKSDNENVATVEDGKVTAIKAGSAVITVTTSNGKTANCTVTVNQKRIPIESVTLSLHDVMLKAGTLQQLTAVIAPLETTDDKTLTWSSSNEAVATVDQNGQITALAKGTTVITVKTSNGLTDECMVTVYEINKKALADAIKTAEMTDKELYTTSSYQNLSNVLESAKIIYDKEDATQLDVDSILAELEATMKLLVERASDTQLQQLTDLLEECKKLQDTVDETEFTTMLSLIHEGEALLIQDHKDIAKQEVTMLYETIVQEKDRLDLVGVRSKLKQMVELANVVLEGDLSGVDGDAIKALRSAVSGAQYLLDTESSDRTLLNTSIELLKKTIAACESKVETTHLRDLIALCESLDLDLYTEESWNEFLLALEDANKLLENGNATQAQINEAYQHLSEKMICLKIKVNTAMLNFNLNIANDMLMRSDDYISSTIRGLDKLVAQAEALLTKKDVTTKEVNEMNITLMKAIMKARLKAN